MAPPKRRVRLWLDGGLIGERWTQQAIPAPWYQIGDVVYDLISFTATRSPDGKPAFDVHVAIR